MFKFKSILILALIALSGCVLSFYPLFGNDEIQYDPGLVGVWNTLAPEHDIDGASTAAKITIRQMGNSYAVEIDQHDGMPGLFKAQIGFIGTNRFIQITPQPSRNVNPATFFGAHFFQAWSFWKLELEGDRMTLGEMNNKLELKHERVVKGSGLENWRFSGVPT
jgi:hypothetical protein